MAVGQEAKTSAEQRPLTENRYGDERTEQEETHISNEEAGTWSECGRESEFEPMKHNDDLSRQ